MLNPAYPVSNVATLRGVNDVFYFTETDGTQYAVDSAGDVYQVTYTGDWMIDHEATALFKGVGEIAVDAAARSANAGQFSFESLLSSINELVPAALQFKLQNDLNQLNLERARRGQAPIDPSRYAPGINVGITNDTKKMIGYGAVGVLALVVLNGVMKRR